MKATNAFSALKGCAKRKNPRKAFFHTITLPILPLIVKIVYCPCVFMKNKNAFLGFFKKILGKKSYDRKKNISHRTEKSCIFRTTLALLDKTWYLCGQ